MGVVVAQREGRGLTLAQPETVGVRLPVGEAEGKPEGVQHALVAADTNGEGVVEAQRLPPPPPLCEAHIEPVGDAVPPPPREADVQGDAESEVLGEAEAKGLRDELRVAEAPPEAEAGPVLLPQRENGGL